MKKSLSLVLIVFSLFICLPSVSLAANPAAKTGIAKKTANTAAMYTDRLAIIQDRFDKTLSMYDSFITKLENVRDTFKNQGKDVTKLDDALTTVRADYAHAEAIVTEAMVNLKAIDYTQSKSVVVRAVIAEIRTVRDSFSELHQSMVAAVKIIKDVRQS
jgi:hypothetical protein